MLALPSGFSNLELNGRSLTYGSSDGIYQGTVELETHRGFLDVNNEMWMKFQSNDGYWRKFWQ